MMQVSSLLPDVSVVLPSSRGCRLPEFKHCSSVFDAKCFTSHGLPKFEVGPEKLRTRRFIVRASEDYGGDLVSVAPVQLESPVGKLLAQILRTHPHLLLATAEQQLKDLQLQQDNEKEIPAQSSLKLLYKRIAEVKEKERRKTLEEIIYCLIVGRFIDNGISMIPKLSTTSDPTGRVDFWPNQEQKLESVHSAEVLEMIRNHVAHALEERGADPLDTIVQVSKFKLGKLYAISIMYGYFLRRVDERYQLDKSTNTLPEGLSDTTTEVSRQLWDPDCLIRIYPVEGDGRSIVEFISKEEKSYKLRSYVMRLDAETLQRYAAIRSKEALSLIEKQTRALFGRPYIKLAEDGSLDTSGDEATSGDEFVALAFSGLTLLVLEALSFGSFLWDAETYVDSKYPFFNS